MDKVILTDFNKDRWSGVNLESVQKCIDELIKKLSIIGEFNPKYNGATVVTLSNASHSIKNISLENGVIYGDVYFFDNDLGEKAQLAYDSKQVIFGIRGVGNHDSNGIEFHEIFTWDLIEK